MLLLIKGNALPHIYLHCRFTTVKWSLVERFENKDRIYLNKNALPSLRSNCKNIFFWSTTRGPVAMVLTRIRGRIRVGQGLEPIAVMIPQSVIGCIVTWHRSRPSTDSRARPGPISATP